MTKRPKPKPKKKRATKSAEKALHYHCQQWLEKSGLWTKLLIFHVPNERRGGIGTIVHFKRMGVRPGVADYLMFGRGRCAAIELKDDEGKQDRDQLKFERQWNDVGNLYCLVRTLEDFQGVVNAFALFC